MKRVEADFFARISCPSRLQTNSDGDLAFVVRTPNLDKNRYDTTHWLYRNNKLRRLRTPAGVTGHWWWDENTLLLATQGGPADRRRARKGLPSTVFQTLNVQQGAKAKTLFTIYADVQQAWPLPEGGALVLARWDPDVDTALAQAGREPDKAAALLETQQGHTAFTELPFWENGEGAVSGKRQRLYLWQDGQLSPLTGADWDVEYANLSRDRKTAYLIVKTYPNGVAPITRRLYALDLPSQALRNLTFGILRLDICLPMENGYLLVAGSDAKAHGLNQNPTFYCLAPDGRPTVLDDTGRYSIWPSVGSDVNQPGPVQWWAKGRAAYLISTLGDSSHLMRLDTTTGQITAITRQPGAVSEAVPAADGWFILALRGLAPPEIWHVQEDGTEMQITRFNDLPNVQLSKPEPLSVRCGKDEVQGWVMLPPGVHASKAGLPGLLYIHGGPKTVYGPVLFHEMQYWAAQGYAVVLCNPKGSDGRGDDFADIRGGYGGQDSRCLLDFLDAALKKYPIIDPKRLGVAGGSYGGFMVNWLIGHSTRFAAAVSQRGISNWSTMALTADIGYYFAPDQAGAGSWQSACGDVERSPLAHIQAVSTPTLFLHSDEDYRCPLPEGLQMYTALKLRGVPTRLVIFHGENHELSRSGRPQNRLHRLEEMRLWLGKYLHPRA